MIVAASMRKKLSNSRIKSKSKPMPEDFLPRFSVESEPEKLLDKYTVRQDSYLWMDGEWSQIGRRYSQVASHKVSDEVLEWVEKNSKDKAAIKKFKEVEHAKRVKKK